MKKCCKKTDGTIELCKQLGDRVNMGDRGFFTVENKAGSLLEVGFKGHRRDQPIKVRVCPICTGVLA